MQTQEKNQNQITKSSIKFSILAKSKCLDFQKWEKKVRVQRPRYTKHKVWG